MIQLTQFYEAPGIFNTENMRVVGEFRAVILVALKLTQAFKGPSLINHRFFYNTNTIFHFSVKFFPETQASERCVLIKYKM